MSPLVAYVTEQFPQLSSVPVEQQLRFLVQASLEPSERRRLQRAVFRFRASAFVIVAIVAGNAFLRPPGGGSVLPVHMVLIAAVLGLLVVIERRLGRESALRAVALRMAHPMCSACCYSLVGIPPTNGVVHCPECGSIEAVACGSDETAG